MAFLIARYLVGVRGLQSFGLALQKNWGKDLLLGFMAGFGIWAVKNFAYYQSGMFEVSGIAGTSEILNILLLGLLASFFPGAMNDLAVRGYWYRYFSQFRFFGLFLVFSTGAYALGDAWNEGFSWFNTVFSLLLGFTLAYSVVRTGAIWMSIGIHTGSNFVYRLMYGLDGRGVLLLENISEGSLYEYLNLLFTAGLFPLVYLLLKNRKAPVRDLGEERAIKDFKPELKSPGN